MKNKLKRILVIFLFIQITVLSTFSIIPGEVDGACCPSLYVVFNPPVTREANIAPGEDSVVQFDGTIWVQIVGTQSVQLIQLNMQADTEAGWPAVVIPSTVVMDPKTTSSIPFFVMVKVPSYTPFTISSKLTISGNAITFPGARQNLFAGDASVLIHQFYGHRISCKDNFEKCHPGDRVKFDIEMLNTGNGYDELELDVKNRARWEKKGWDIHEPSYEKDANGAMVLNTTHISMREKGFGSIVVDVPSDIDEGKYRMIIQTRSITSKTIENRSSIQELEVVIVVEKDLVRCLFLPAIALILIVIFLSLVMRYRAELKSEKQKIRPKRKFKVLKVGPNIKYKKLKKEITQ